MPAIQSEVCTSDHIKTERHKLGICGIVFCDLGKLKRCFRKFVQFLAIAPQQNAIVGLVTMSIDYGWDALLYVSCGFITHLKHILGRTVQYGIIRSRPDHILQLMSLHYWNCMRLALLVYVIITSKPADSKRLELDAIKRNTHFPFGILRAASFRMS